MRESPNSHIIVNYLMSQGVVAYQRGLARAVGDHSAGLLLSQFWYWAERQPQERNGWFFMTQEQIHEETVMTRREQETARRKLRELGILEESKRGVPAKLWFRINSEAVISLLETHLQTQDGGIRQARMAESAILGSPKVPSKDGGIRHTIDSKISAESSSKISAAESPSHSGSPPNAQQDSAAADLAQELMRQEVNRADALRLVKTHFEECQRQLQYLPFKIAELGGEQHFKTGKGAYLRSAIEGGFAPPTACKVEKERSRLKREKQSTQKQQAARTAHYAQYQAAYYAYLRIIEQQLAKDHPENYTAFQIQTEETRQRLAKLSSKKPLEAFCTEEAHANRLVEFFALISDRTVLSFWDWDAHFNAERLQSN